MEIYWEHVTRLFKHAFRVRTAEHIVCLAWEKWKKPNKTAYILRVHTHGLLMCFRHFDHFLCMSIKFLTKNTFSSQEENLLLAMFRRLASRDSLVGQVFATFATFFYSFQQLPKYSKYMQFSASSCFQEFYIATFCNFFDFYVPIFTAIFIKYCAKCNSVIKKKYYKTISV